MAAVDGSQRSDLATQTSKQQSGTATASAPAQRAPVDLRTRELQLELEVVRLQAKPEQSRDTVGACGLQLPTNFAKPALRLQLSSELWIARRQREGSDN